MDKVSVIIPAYNCVSSIEKCIKSIIEQSYKNIEIIIIDDGSTDKTGLIIDELSKMDNRIIVIHQKNAGVSVARNKGIDIATGKYIMFIDSDDWIESTCVSEVVCAIKEKKVDIVRFNYIKEDLNKSCNQKMYDLSNEIFKGNEVISEKVISHLLYTKNSIPNYVMLLIINSKLLKDNKIYFNKDLYMMEDVYFYQELLHHTNSIYFLDRCLYHYNNCNVSVTRDANKAVKNIYGIFECGIKTKKLLDDNMTKYSLDKINSCHLNLSITYLNKAISISNYNQSKKIIKELLSNKYFDDILNNHDNKDITNYRKLVLFLIKKKLFIGVYIMLKFRFCLKNIKK